MLDTPAARQHGGDAEGGLHGRQDEGEFVVHESRGQGKWPRPSIAKPRVPSSLRPAYGIGGKQNANERSILDSVWPMKTGQFRLITNPDAISRSRLGAPPGNARGEALL
jgi:hypothetical protein